MAIFNDGFDERQVAAEPDYSALVSNAYGGIGRTGFGDQVSAIDRSGFDYWTNQLATGALTPQNFQTAFSNAVQNQVAANPTDAYSQYVSKFIQPAANGPIVGAPAATSSTAVAAPAVAAPAVAPAVTAPVQDEIEQLYNTYANRWSDPTGYAYWAKEFGPTVDQAEKATFLNSLAEARRLKTEPDLFTKGLTGTSTPEQIAAAYNQFATATGSNIADVIPKATDYLSKQGISSDILTGGYNQYLGDYKSGIANKVFDSFSGASTAAPLTGILSGFEALGRGDFDESTAKRLLGTDKFNEYKKAFGDETKKFTSDLLADNNLSAQESIDFVNNARKYGLDADKFSSLTGYKKDVYDVAKNQFDTVADKLVDQAFKDKDDLGDRIKTGLALQSKFGFTNEDIAKAADLTPQQVNNWFDPVRNFGETYEKAVKKPDASSKDILSFVDTALNSEGVKAVYGDKLAEIKGRIEGLNDKWQPYGVDGYQAENIYNQINKITEAAGGKNWSGSWMSGGDNAAMQAAKLLVNKGVDNLTDLGVKQNVVPDVAVHETFNGQTVKRDEKGKAYIPTYNVDGEESGKSYLSPNAQIVPNKLTGQGEYDSLVPLTKEELATYDPATGKFKRVENNQLIDKSTGKVISTSTDNNFSLDRYSTGNFFKGKDKTFGIAMTNAGVPVPYTSTEKTGLVTTPILPLLASAFMPGIGTAISSGISGAVGTGLANAALTQGIISGGMAGLTGGNIGKAFLSGAIGNPVSAGIASLLPAGIDPNLGRFVTNVGTNIARGAITGNTGNLGNSLLNAGLQYAGSQLPLDLTPQQVNLMAGIATPLLQGQNINPLQLGGILTNYALSNLPKTGATR